MKRICVFSGSSPGINPEYARVAKLLGKTLVENNTGLVYGGASIGMMGMIAKTVVENGGDVIGVIPKELADKNVAYTELKDLRIVDTMHQRKAKMVELADGFIALPGGLGTIEEFLEVLTWAQLGIHEKPCGLLDVCGYYDKMLDFLQHAVDQQFMEQEHYGMIISDGDPVELLKKFETYRAPKVDKAKWALRFKNK
ncbi:MAG: TIGR00730 family Rossman fold protein [bacterium]|nr:TIGR00730 family Rossman fold protein [bacterium]